MPAAGPVACGDTVARCASEVVCHLAHYHHSQHASGAFGQHSSVHTRYAHGRVVCVNIRAPYRTLRASAARRAERVQHAAVNAEQVRRLRVALKRLRGSDGAGALRGGDEANALRTVATCLAASAEAILPAARGGALRIALGLDALSRQPAGARSGCRRTERAMEWEGMGVKREIQRTEIVIVPGPH